MAERGGRPTYLDNPIEKIRPDQRRNRWTREAKAEKLAQRQPEPTSQQSSQPEQPAPAKQVTRERAERRGSVVLEFRGKAASKLMQLRNITERRDEAEVVSDALYVYEWILREQATGGEVVLSGETSDEPVNTLRNYVQNREKARSYFEPIANRRSIRL